MCIRVHYTTYLHDKCVGRAWLFFLFKKMKTHKCVCACVCTYMWMSARVCACMGVCVCSRARTRMCEKVKESGRSCAYACVHVCACVCVRVFVCERECVSVYVGVCCVSEGVRESVRE